MATAYTIVLLLTLIYPKCFAFFITVDANDVSCFFLRAKNLQSKIVFSFEVFQGGFLDVDVDAKGPYGNVIWTVNGTSSGSLLFAVDSIGDFTFCFNNTMNTLTPKYLKFHLKLESTIEDTSPSTVQGMVNNLNNALKQVKQEQEYILLRAMVHREVSEKTNLRVGYWAIFQSVIMGTITIMQVTYLKRFFDVRRIV